jgi:uncharacterized protein (TIGR03083 family)
LGGSERETRVALDRNWLLGVARAEREALGRTVQYTPPERWEEDSPRDGWQLRDIVAHLDATEAMAASVIADEAPSELDEYAKSLDDPRSLESEAFNRWAVDKRRESPALSLALDWGRSADVLLVRVAGTTDDDWNGRDLRWMTEELPVAYFLQNRVCQWWVHGEDIRAGALLPPRMEHPPIFCVNDLAVRLMPYALGRAGLVHREKSISIDLEAVGGGKWHRGLEPGYDPPKDKQPDAFIIGRAHAFALVAFDRADVDVCLYDGILNMGGDLEIAEAVLRNLRAFV